MALVICAECRKEVSTSAKTCPNCGAKLKHSLVVPLLIGFVVIGLLGNLLDRKDASSNVKDTAVLQTQTATFSQGSRNANLDLIVTQLSPLIESYRIEEDGLFVRMQINASAWNGMSSSEQQQIGDMLATRKIVQNMKSILYLYVYQTKVGEVGPGWGGEWKFRRTQ